MLQTIPPLIPPKIIEVENRFHFLRNHDYGRKIVGDKGIKKTSTDFCGNKASEASAPMIQ